MPVEKGIGQGNSLFKYERIFLSNLDTYGINVLLKDYMASKSGLE